VIYAELHGTDSQKPFVIQRGVFSFAEFVEVRKMGWCSTAINNDAADIVIDEQRAKKENKGKRNYDRSISEGS